MKYQPILDKEYYIMKNNIKKSMDELEEMIKNEDASKRERDLHKNILKRIKKRYDNMDSDYISLKKALLNIGGLDNILKEVIKYTNNMEKISEYHLNKNLSEKIKITNESNLNINYLRESYENLIEKENKLKERIYNLDS